MRRVLVAIPFKADNVTFEANKEYDLEDAVIERALKTNPNMLTVIGCGDEFAELKASLEAETKARIEAEAKAEAEAAAKAEVEEELSKATEELSKVKEELTKVKKQLSKAKKEN